MTILLVVLSAVGAFAVGFIWGVAYWSRVNFNGNVKLRKELEDMTAAKLRTEYERNRAVDAFHQLRRGRGIPGLTGAVDAEYFNLGTEPEDRPAAEYSHWDDAAKYFTMMEFERKEQAAEIFDREAHKIPHRDHSDVLKIHSLDDLIEGTKP